MREKKTESLDIIKNVYLLSLLLLQKKRHLLQNNANI